MSKNIFTRKIARTVLVLLKKTGGLSLKKLHEYIKQAHPKDSPDIIKLNTVLQKASAIGAIKKKNNRYTLGNLIKNQHKPMARRRFPVRRICGHKGRGRRGRSRSRRGRKTRLGRGRKSRSKRRRH